MKKYLPLVFLLLFISCTQSPKTQLHGPKPLKGLVYGDSVLDNNIKDVSIIRDIMNDNTNMKMKVCGVINQIGKQKNCFALMEIGKGETMQINFKDASYYLPQKYIGKKVVVEGEVRVNNVSVEQQKNYALNMGKTPVQIQNITSAKTSLAFEATGLVVL